MYTGDIVIHIDEELDNDRIHDLERQIGNEHGVYSACMHEKTRHLMVADSTQTGHPFQRKLDTRSRATWTVGAKRRAG